MEFGVLLSEQAVVAHVFKALDEYLIVLDVLLLLEVAMDIEHAAIDLDIIIRVEWILKVDSEWVVEEV